LIEPYSVLVTDGISVDYLKTTAIAFCVFGGVMVIISFLGCCGAFMQVRCLLIMYGTILLLILLAEIGIVIFAAVFTGKFKDTITPLLQKSIEDNYVGVDSDTKPVISLAWDAIMYNAECCGVNNGTDFNNAKLWIKNKPADWKSPQSCCKFENIKTDWSGNLPNMTNNKNYPQCVQQPDDKNSNFDMVTIKFLILKSFNNFP
jgi:hypothetical protein